MNIHDIQMMKSQGKRISMVTCYDYTFAKIVAKTGINCILVGDSVAMVMHGHATTIPATVDLMALHISAVAKGAGDKFIVGDLPFLSYRKDLNDTMHTVEKMMHAGAHAVKLEGVVGNEQIIQHIIASGVPVMGHIGLTPQSIHQLGGFRVQGKTLESAEIIYQQALTLENLGCSAIVLECIPDALAARITEQLRIPTIGIGAGPHTDGQVLVLQDLLNMDPSFKPKFVKSYLDGFTLMQQALNAYDNEVKSGVFPQALNAYDNEVKSGVFPQKSDEK